MCCCLMAAENFGHACHAECLVRRKSSEHVGQSFRHLFAHATRNDEFEDWVVLRFDEVGRRAAGEFTKV